MKQFILLAFMSFLVFDFPSPSPAGAQDTFVVSGNPKAPPVVWEQYNKLVGLGPDLATTILGELGIAHTLKVPNNWKEVQTKAKQGEIDLIVSVYKNKNRAEYLSFSIPYMAQPVVIVVEKGKEFTFSSWDTLKGKQGVSNLGESYGQEFDDFIEQNLSVKYLQLERALQVLNLGEVDYLIVDLYTALIYARLLQGEDRVTILDPPVTVQNFHMGVRSDSALVSHLPDINKKLAELIKNGTVSTSLLNYFDKWKELSDRRASYFAKQKVERSKDQELYLKEQDEIARQRIIGTMTDWYGLPAHVE